MADAFSIKFDHSDADAALDKLAASAQANARPAAQAGAQILYDEVKRNVAALGRVSGRLFQAIYQAYSADNSGDGRATYHVSWNYRKAPHGHLVEYGHVQTNKVYIGSDGHWYTSSVPLPAPKHVAANPFLRPAFDAKAAQALQAAKQVWEQKTGQTIAEING